MKRSNVNNLNALSIWKKHVAIALSGFAMLAACSPAPKTNKVAVDDQQASSAKPDPVARIRVLEAVSRELSRLERMVKPHLEKPVTGRPSCATREINSNAQHFVRWKCNAQETTQPRVEIEGTEWTTQRPEAIEWFAESRLETRLVDMSEDSLTAPGFKTFRRLELRWARNSTPNNGEATIVYRVAHEKLLSRKRPGGPNWNMILRGTIDFSNGTARLAPNSLISVTGLVSGQIDDFATTWANGQFELIAQTPITLNGLMSDTCTRPFGTWEMTASGAGETVRTELTTDATGGRDFSGSSFSWPQDLCSGS